MGIVSKRNKYYRCLEYNPDRTKEICLVGCGLEQCNPGQDCGPDQREHWHLHAILSGKGVLYAGGKEYHPHFGQLFLLKDMETVHYIADQDEPWNYCWVTYCGRNAQEFSEEIGFSDGVYCIDCEADMNSFFDLVRRMHEKPEMNHINDLRRQGILLEFLALAMESVRGDVKRRIRKPEYPNEVYIRRAVDFIHHNYATITVNDMVEYIGFSRSHFTITFKKQMGISPQDYLMQYRFHKAAQMLVDTNLQVQEISSKVGYEDSLVFSKAFKKKYGMSPTDYRTNKIQSEGFEG